MSRTPGRRRDLDIARGIAVLLMIEAHTTDAWTRAASRATLAYRDAVVFGGFAAPLFLWLAGIGAVMSASRLSERTGSRTVTRDAVVHRGLEIFVLAFLFRLQAFVLSPGGSPVMLFRVDILNIMGPAIACSALIWWMAGTGLRQQLIAFGVATAATAMVTPIVRASPLVDALPSWAQWYVRPAGEHTTFTLFPWMAFVFAGGATGALITTATDAASERRIFAAIAISGVALVVLGFATAAQPSIYSSSSFWTSSPTWFAIRLGILMIALSVITLCANVGALAPIGRLGQTSLFVYWIHVELVYGYASWWWRGRLPLWATVAGCAAFSVLMYGVVALKDRATAWWRTRQGAVQSATT